MKFLTDENVSPAVVRALRTAGHNVLDVKEQRWQGVADEVILRRARQTGRVIVSEDLDFGNLRRYPLTGHPGAILLHLADMRPREVAERLLTFLSGVRSQTLRGAVVFLEEGQVQVVKL
jgi:predicted nuclease of predicted toxin-antitoxin system